MIISLLPFLCIRGLDDSGPFRRVDIQAVDVPSKDSSRLVDLAFVGANIDVTLYKQGKINRYRYSPSGELLSEEDGIKYEQVGGKVKRIGTDKVVVSVKRRKKTIDLSHGKQAIGWLTPDSQFVAVVDNIFARPTKISIISTKTAGLLSTEYYYGSSSFAYLGAIKPSDSGWVALRQMEGVCIYDLRTKKNVNFVKGAEVVAADPTNKLFGFIAGAAVKTFDPNSGQTSTIFKGPYPIDHQFLVSSRKSWISVRAYGDLNVYDDRKCQTIQIRYGFAPDIVKVSSSKAGIALGWGDGHITMLLWRT